MNRSRLRKNFALSESDEWRTPARVYRYAERRYGPFLLDVAAARWNHQVARYFAIGDGALERTWALRNWCNCPYSSGNKEAFTRWGRLQILEFGKDLSCHLLPHDTADGYWTRHIEAPAGRFRGVSKELGELGPIVRTSWQHLDVEVTAINFRIRYSHESRQETTNARHASALVVFARPGLLRPLVQASGHFQGAA